MLDSPTSKGQDMNAKKIILWNYCNSIAVDAHIWDFQSPYALEYQFWLRHPDRTLAMVVGAVACGVWVGQRVQKSLNFWKVHLIQESQKCLFLSATMVRVEIMFLEDLPSKNNMNGQ